LIGTTKNGKIVLSELSKSKNIFNYTNTFAKLDGRVVENANQFSPYSKGGGEIHIKSAMENDKNIQQQISSVAHETFHGFQKENGESLGNANSEVGAYLFGASVAFEAILNSGSFPSEDQFGNGTLIGNTYQKAMLYLLYNDYSQYNYSLAVYTFAKGSSANTKGIYDKVNNHGAYRNLNPIIKRFFPLVNFK
jgi:hypothetical protein